MVAAGEEQLEGTIRIEVPAAVASDSSTSEHSLEAARALQDAIPVGSDFVAFLIRAPQGHLEMSQPDAWALVLGDAVVPASSDRNAWPTSLSDLGLAG